MYRGRGNDGQEESTWGRLPASAVRLVGTLAVGSLAAACGDAATGPTSSDDPPLDPTLLGTIQCQVSSAGMSCGTEGSASPDGTGAALKTTTVGGQDIFVTLASTMDNPLDDGSDGDTGNDDGTVRAFVTVTNLLVQPMATTNSDGSALADSDLKVFFDTGPTVTGGSGSVSVANEDGTGTFTASGQKFFQFDQGGSASAGSDTDDYTGTLATDETTNAQTEPWEFSHDQGVTAFDFTVFVTVDLPHENSVYRSVDRNTGTVGSKNLRGLWGASADEAWVAAGDGTILHTTDGGANWTDQSSGTSNRLNALWGASGSELWAAGDVQSDWFDTDWPNRKKITVQSSQVDGPLSDFPVLVSLTDADIQAAAQADGDDILFTNSDGTTQLDHEIEKWDSGSGELVAWVRVPSLPSSSNKDLYVYYGNGSAADQQNAAGVWDANYKGVWHLSEDPSGTAPQMEDATSNGNDGTTNGSMTSGDQIAAQVDGGLDLDGSDDFVEVCSDNCSASLNITGNEITLEAWTRTPSGGMNDDEGFILKGDAGNSENYMLGVEDNISSGSVTRVQSVNNTGPTDGVTTSWSSQPSEGNLLVVISGHRESDQNPVIQESGWTRHFVETGDINNSSHRRAVAIWSKVAGASEGDVTVDWQGTSTDVAWVIMQEFTGGGTYSFHEAGGNGQQSTTSLNVPASATSAPSSPDVLVVAGMTSRDDVSSPSFDNLGSVVHNTLRSDMHGWTGFTSSNSGDQGWQTTASWTNSRDVSGLLAVFTFDAGIQDLVNCRITEQDTDGGGADDDQGRIDFESVPQNEWTYVVCRYDAANGSEPLQAWVNGSKVQSTATTDDGGALDNNIRSTSSDDLLFGRRIGSRFNEGDMDELRISDVARSDAYITTTYNNQNSPGTFYTLGSEESAAGTIRSTTDGGTNWGSQTAGVGRDLRDVFGASASDIWAVGNNGVITHFNGTSWSTQTSNTSSDLRGVWAANSRDVWAVGAGGEIRRTSDGGSSWGSETSPVATALNDVWGAGTDDVWAVGAGGVLIHRSGGSWSEDSQSGSLTTENLLSVFGNGASDVFAVGANGTLLHYDGTDWMEMTSRAGATTAVRGVWAADATTAWIAADGGTVRELSRDLN